MTEPVRVLLVDDEPDFLESVSFWLTSKGYQVEKTSDGETAVSLIQSNPPHIVFLDCMMPKIDGFETLRRIRAINKTLPVIMVTAGVGDENKFAGARALGLSGFFPKGTGLEQLAKVLEISLRILPKPQPESVLPVPREGISPEARQTGPPPAQPATAPHPVASRKPGFFRTLFGSLFPPAK